MNKGWWISALHWDLLWESLELGEYPFPLQVRSHGQTLEERSRLKVQMTAQLHSGALMRQNHLDTELERALRVIGRPRMWLDSVWLPNEQAKSPFRAIAATDGESAALVVQQPGNQARYGGALWLEPIPPACLAPAILAALPATAEGKGQIAANSIDRHGTLRRSKALHWFDNAPTAQRYLCATSAAPNGSDQLTLIPANKKNMTTELQKLFAGVRA